MKKIVSLALTTAMAFSMFASVTSAATLTTQEKYNALVTQGIFAGYPNGEAYLDKDMTRAEFAKVVALLTGLDTAATTTSTYVDQNYANAWYKPYVEAVTKAGYMKGTTTGTKKLFNPNGKVTVQEMAATLVRAAKLEIPTTGIDNGAAAWAKGEVQAAINAGLISKTSNFAGAATRGLLVDTAYAYQTALSKPAVASYEVTDNGATVVFTLANGEKVTVKPTTALQPNVATTVTFKYNDFDYSESVTWKVTNATKVDSAMASNLREVTVKFDGKVNKETAENPNNYSITNAGTQTVNSASLSEDGTTVTLSLSTTLVNNRSTKLDVNNVRVAEGTTLIKGSVNFVPSDVSIPTVTAVKALGTGAVEVTFSEPVQPTSLSVSNVWVDGKVVPANLEVSASSVIISTPLTVGDHTLRLSGVTDYSGLVMVPTEQKFTVVADTTAPTIVSASSYDMYKVTVKLSEPARSVSSGTVNGKAATVSKSGDTVTLTLDKTDANRMSFSANTVVLNGVTDYSGNTANSLTTTVTPTLDLVAPTVLSTSTGIDNGSYYVDVQFSKEVNAADRNFFTLKTTGGVLVTKTGLTPAGHPVVTPVNKGSNVWRVTLGSTSVLTEGSYTLEVAGVRDATYAQNYLTPFTGTISLSTTAAKEITRAWAQTVNATNYLYVEFSNTLSTTGATSALDAVKYQLKDGTTLSALATDNVNVELVGANTVRINTGARTPADLATKTVVASYVGDIDGNYFRATTTGPVAVEKTISLSNAAISVSNQSALAITNGRQLTVNFSTPVVTPVASDITLTPAGGTGIKASSVVMSNNNKTATLTFPDTLNVDFTTANLDMGTVKDNFSNSTTINGLTVQNDITPTATGNGVTVARGATTFTVDIPLNRAVQVNAQATALNLLTATVGSQAVKATAVTTANSGKTLVVTFENPTTVPTVATDLVVSFDGTGNTAKLIATADATAAGSDALGSFTASAQYNGATTGDNVAPTVTSTAVANTAVSPATQVYTQGPVAFTWADTDVRSATLDNGTTAVAYAKDASVTDAGVYHLTVTDNAGNVTDRYFTIDKTAPTATVASGTSTAINLTLSDVAFGTTPVDVTGGTATFTEGAFDATAKTVSLTGVAAANNDTVIFTVTDKAGNVKTYTATFSTATGAWTLA